MFQQRFCLLVALFGLLLIAACKKETIAPQQVKAITSGTTDRLNKILFVNDSIGFVVGGDRFLSSTILRTTDGGQTFTPFSITASSKTNTGITFRQDGTVIVVGFDAKFITSQDTGRNWSLTQLDSWRPLKDLGYFNVQEGLIIDGISFNSGVLYRVNAQGTTHQRDSFNYEFNDLEITSATDAFVVGTGVVMRTQDKGASWTLLDIKNDNFTAITFADANHAWVCGSEGSIFYTSDRGNNWQRQRNANNMFQKKYHFHDILFIDLQNGYVVGDDGIMLRTADGGNNWEPIKSFTSKHLRQIESCPQW